MACRRHQRLRSAKNGCAREQSAFHLTTIGSFRVVLTEISLLHDPQTRSGPDETPYATFRGVLRQQGRQALSRPLDTERGWHEAHLPCRRADLLRFSGKVIAAFDSTETLRKVTVDVAEAHPWDITAVGALDKIVLKYRRQNIEIAVVGVNEASAHMLDRFALHDKEHAGFSASGEF